MNLLKELDSSIAAFQQQAISYADYRYDHGQDLNLVSEAFESIKGNVIRVNIDTDCIDIAVTGDLGVLSAAFKALRTHGFEPDDRPGIELFTSFSTYFKHPQKKLKFWLSFSSSKCTRVKVGTKTEEVNVYEITCE